MKQQDWLFVGLGSAILLWIAAQTDSGEEFVSDVVDYGGDVSGEIMSTIRGIRNNNPGNIRISTIKWQGLAPEQTDGSFFQFISVDYGIRAMAKIITTYRNSYGLNTVRGIVNRWAPPNENDTNSYVNFVAEQMGVSPDMSINTNDPSIMQALIRAIIKQENGYAGAALIDDSSIINGVRMA